MNRFPRFLNTILIGSAALIAVGCSQVIGADVLIYSDHTPGSLAFYAVERLHAVNEGHTVTTVTGVSAFEDELDTGTWEYVVAVAHYASGDPAYADELRDYSEADDENWVDLLIWHDNGTTPGNDTAVMGTTAIASWSRGRTTVSYVNTTGASGSATTSSGLNFPDFSGISTFNPTLLVQADPDDIQGFSWGAIIAFVLALLDDPCDCLHDWSDDIGDCDDTHETQTGHCNSQFPVPPSENMDDLNDCLDTADKHRSNCRRSAATTYKGCIAECEAEQ